MANDLKGIRVRIPQIGMVNFPPDLDLDQIEQVAADLHLQAAISDLKSVIPRPQQIAPQPIQPPPAQVGPVGQAIRNLGLYGPVTGGIATAAQYPDLVKRAVTGISSAVPYALPDIGGIEGPVIGAAKTARFSVGKALSKEERNQILKLIRDTYEDHGIKKTEFKYLDERSGAEVYGYPYTPETFKTSDITGAKVRHYVTLPDGRVAHPSELYPEIKQADIDHEILQRKQQAKWLEEQRQTKLARVIATGGDKNTANLNYSKTGRKLPGSYFAQNEAGEIVRVDGKDLDDVKFYEELGFKPISPPVPSANLKSMAPSGITGLLTGQQSAQEQAEKKRQVTPNSSLGTALRNVLMRGPITGGLQTLAQNPAITRKAAQDVTQAVPYALPDIGGIEGPLTRAVSQPKWGSALIKALKERMPPQLENITRTFPERTLPTGQTLPAQTKVARTAESQLREVLKPELQTVSGQREWEELGMEELLSGKAKTEGQLPEYITELRGRWFTPDESIARREAGAKGIIKVVDVNPEVANALDYGSLPGRPERILPPELAKQAISLEQAGPLAPGKIRLFRGERTVRTELLKPQNWLAIGPLGLTAMLAGQIGSEKKREELKSNIKQGLGKIADYGKQELEAAKYGLGQVGEGLQKGKEFFERYGGTPQWLQDLRAKAAPVMEPIARGAERVADVADMATFGAMPAQLAVKYLPEVMAKAAGKGPYAGVYRNALKMQELLDERRAAGAPLRKYNPEKPWIESNVEYGKSVDPDLLCQRSEGLDIAVNRMKTKLGDQYNPELAKVAYDRAVDKGLKVSCPQCYVFWGRKGGGFVQKRFGEGVGGYSGELPRMSEATLEEMRTRGFRHYSSTDMKAEHGPGLIAEIAEAAELKVPVAGYSKEADFARMFGDTGVYINMSVGRDARVGMDFKTATELRRKYPNIATVYVPFDDAEVLAALRHPDVDHVIPWHTSGAKVEDMQGILKDPKVRNYTREQSETINGIKVKEPIKEIEHKGDLATYLKLVEERGYTKKFSRIYDMLGPDEKHLYMKMIGPEYGKFKVGATEVSPGRIYAPPDPNKINMRIARQVLERREQQAVLKVRDYNNIADQIVTDVRGTGK